MEDQKQKVTVTKTTKVTTTTTGPAKPAKRKAEEKEKPLEKKLPLQEKIEQNGPVQKKPKVEKKVPEKKPNILSLMYKEEAFVDFYIRGKTKAFPCHRVILAAGGSPILRGYMIENMTEEGAMGELQLGYANNVVEKFVKYFYGEPITDERMKDNFEPYMELAERFNLPEMKEQVEKEALKHLNTDLNMVELYFKADQFHNEFKAERVKTAAKAAIKKNKAKIQENIEALGKKLKKTQLSNLLSILTE